MSRSKSPSPILILDNGASTIKAGLASDPAYSAPRLFPNSWARSKEEKRTFVADELDQARDLSALNYRSPFDRGYLMGWETERPIWDRVFSQLAIEPGETSLFLTEAYNNPAVLQEATDQMVFEYWGFQSLYRATPAPIVAQSPGVLFADEVEPGRRFGSNPECVVVIDTGYSFTHVVPVMCGQPVQKAIRRVDVGGKLLTNHLKTLISFRHWTMMDETHVINEIKEMTCFVSKNFTGDLDACHRDPGGNRFRQEYVLPDFSSASRKRGFVKTGDGVCAPLVSEEDEIMAGNEDDEQLLPLANERFAVPEVLFHPSDIGLQQAGLAEAVANSIASLPSEIQGLFWGNISLMGGNTCMPGLANRLKVELQQLSPFGVNPSVRINKDPSTTAYSAIQRLFSRNETRRWARENFARCAVTKAEYDELGADGLARRRRQVREWDARWAGWDG